MHADAHDLSTTPADLTPPEGSGLAPTEGGVPGAVPNDGNPVLAVENDFGGNGYTAAPTDSGDSERTADSSSDLGSNAALQARPSLGGRASVSETAAQAPTSVTSVGFAELDVPGADPSDEIEPFIVESTPAQVAEAKEFFACAKAAESPEQTKRARMQSRVFSVMQYREHPKTGALMLTQEQINEGLTALGDRLHRWAYIWHDSDRLVEVDEGTGETVCCGIKGLHAHMVLWVADADGPRPTIRTVSDAFSILSARVKPPKETAEQEGTEHKGRGAAEKAFFDLVEYLTHESRGKNAIPGVHQPDRHYLVDKDQPENPGKYQYGRGRVVSNFNYGNELDAHMAMRRNAAEGGGGAKLSKLFQAVGKGSLTLKQVRDQEPAIYFAKGNLEHFRKLRGDFLAYQDAPESVMNFYVFGEGGTGKDLLAKALARALAPDADKPYFKVGGENVSWEGYDGEAVVIWEDMRVGDMIRTAKSRGMLFRILGPWREPDEKPIVNIKGSKTQLLNRVNIVTGPEGYEEFLRGLAGEYESMQGSVRVKHQAENLGQGFRRFPVIIPVAEREFSIFVNSGVLNGTREYQSYERYEHMRQDLELLARRCKAIKDTAERERVRGEIEARTVAPIVEQHDRIARPQLEAINGDDLFEEFAGVGQPIQPSAEEIAIAEAAAKRDREIAEEQQRKLLAELEEHNRELKLCTCSTPQSGTYARHGDDCSALSEEERKRRADAKRKALDAKVERLRANGGAAGRGRCAMSTECDAHTQGIEGGEAPSQAATEDTSASDVSDGATACHSGVQVEQQADSQVNTGRTDVEAVRQSHGGAKRRRDSGGRLDTRFDDATLGALRTRANRLGLAPSTWVRSVVRDSLHASRSEELDAAVAAHLLGVEARVQASADARELAAQVRPLAINVNDLDWRARAGEAVALSAEVPELIELLREVRALLGDRTAS